MAVREIEIILARQLADSLSVPIFITDINGQLIFFNEPAEKILGKQFRETGAMPVKIWSNLFIAQDLHGNRIPRTELPLTKTLTHCQPEQAEFWIKNIKNEQYYITVTSFPLIGRSNRFVGALVIFWQKDAP